MISDIVKSLIRIKCGLESPDMLREQANRLIDDGQWSDGFDIAVSSQPLGRHQNEELFCVLKKHLGLNDLNFEDTVREVQNISRCCLDIDMVVPDIHTVIISDYTSLYKIKDGVRVWTTDRISIDGIRGLRIVDGRVLGQWFSPIDDYANREPWHDFSVDIQTGYVAGSCGWQ